MTRGLALVLALALFPSMVDGAPSACGTPLVEKDISLGVDPRDLFQSDVKMDIYHCQKGANANNPSPSPPLVVFACGGSIRKELYESFASGLAARGYTIAVIDHRIQFPFSPQSFNFATAVDINNVIQYFEEDTSDPWTAVDLENIVLMGHSYGGGALLNAINEQCPPPFCAPGTTVELSSGVVLAASFGFSLYESRFPDLCFISNLKNVDIPLAIINGAGDTNYFEVQCGATLRDGTFDVLLPTKVMPVIDNINHFSILDFIPFPREGDIPSTLPQDEQIGIVVNAMEFWLKKNLKGKTTNNFCNQLTGRGEEYGYNVIDCVEEYE